MKEEDFKLLIESIKQAGEIRAGRLKPSRKFTIKTQDVKNVRKTLHVTQIQFSNMIGVTVDTIQNWEQGRRKPNGPARALLQVAKHSPKAVLEALHGKKLAHA